MDRLSQNETYKILSRIKKTILKNSSDVGGIPVSISPAPITRNPSEKNNMLIIFNADRNFALIM